MPLKASVILSVDVKDVLVRVNPAFLLAVTIPVAVSLSEPFPVQRLTLNLLAAVVAARFTVVMPLRPSDMPSVEARDVLVSVYPCSCWP